MKDINDFLAGTCARIEATLDRCLPSESEEPVHLHQAMRYSLMGGGKRLRPALCLASACAVGGKDEAALIPAAALEIFHTYTLIHDDLPAMDDDLLRRGRPTCHIAFNEATAILAGDALLTLAFRLLCDVSCQPPYTPTDLVRELATAGGSTGVIGGQMADIEGEGKPMSLDQLLYIHTHKTGDLIRASVRLGAMTVGATADHLEALTRYAEKVGLAFQIADDVLNATGDEKALGKAAGTDAVAGKMTYVAAYGIDDAKVRAKTLLSEAKAELDQLPGDAEILKDLADYVINRNK
ncbi:MAG TPA: polyprenyl synthetase family protein [Kiritimatiellia bacterium]|mgnify:CR=1 FL=1|nr:polyprenyl synthetase family protein [Kiritimatiellia bacterium]